MKQQGTSLKRVLFDANSLMGQPTGVGYYTTGLIAALAQANPSTTFIGYYYNFLGRKKPPLRPQAANITYRPIYHLPGPIVNLLRRCRIEVPVELLALMKADFILYPNFLGQPSLFKTPNAPVVHDLMFRDYPQYGSDKAVRDLTNYIPDTLHRASFVLAVSDFTKQRLADSYQLRPQTILSTYIPPVAIETVSRQQQQAILKKHNLTKPYMLFVGTMEPRKNLTNLLKAYSLLPPETRQQYSLVLAGKIDWKYQQTKDALESLQADNHDIHYLGYVDNATRAALYQGARLMVLTSHYEGFGMQILESLQYGVPCAVSDIPVLHEVGGTMVDYFDHADPHAIAECIGRSLAKARPAASRLQAYVSRQPTWPDVATKITTRIKESL